MEKAILSKSSFIRGLQCLKSLYLHKKRPFLRDKLSAAQLNKFDRGHEVGLLAQKMFPGGEDCSPASPSAFRKSVEKTLALMENKFPVLYEATLLADEVLIMADILVWNGVTYDMYEVKSSLKISQTYLYDVALQYLVMQRAGLNPGAAHIVHINPDYLYEGGEIDPLRFFRVVNVTQDALALQDQVKTTLEVEKQVLSTEGSPDIPIGPWCFSPYPCDFMGHCWKNEPSDSVARLESVSPEERFQWKKLGIKTWADLENMDLQNIMLTAEVQARSSGRPFVNPQRLAENLNLIANASLSFILAAENAIPQIPMTHPFDPVPIAWGFSKNPSRATVWISTETNSIEMKQIGFLESGLKDEMVIVTWGSRAVKILQRLFPETSIVDLNNWLWSDFLYFPWTKINADPLSFAVKAGLIQATTERFTMEDVLRKHYKGQQVSDKQLNNYISTQLDAMHLIITLLQKITIQ
ncbi:MAG: hypothetical protein ACP5O2_03170 [Bacteroidales bacterium]